MANTQTTVPTFIPGQVLEAAQLVNSAATGVPVFATTVTRDAGFGGAGEKTLAEGQLCYLESTNVVQYYDGASWATLAPAPAASSGLTWIASQTLSGSSTTFSNAFSATYDNYFITVNNFSLTSGGGSAVNMRIGGETSGYSVSQWYGSYNSAGINSLEFGSASTSSWRIGQPAGTTIDELGVIQIMLFNPFKTKRTVMQNQQTATIADLQIGTGTQSSQSSFTDFTILCAASTFNGGLVNVYGYALS